MMYKSGERRTGKTLRMVNNAFDLVESSTHGEKVFIVVHSQNMRDYVTRMIKDLFYNRHHPYIDRKNHIQFKNLCDGSIEVILSCSVDNHLRGRKDYSILVDHHVYEGAISVREHEEVDYMQSFIEREKAMNESRQAGIKQDCFVNQCRMSLPVFTIPFTQ